MLVRMATCEDKPAWLALSQEYDKYVCELTSDMALWYDGFDSYMDTKIRKNEAAIAVDRRTGRCYGVIAFSRDNNRITFFGVSESAAFDETAERLFTVTLRQLNTDAAIAACVLAGAHPVFKKEIAVFERHDFTITGETLEQGVKAHSLLRRATNDKCGKSFHYRYPKFIRESQEEFCPCITEPESDDTSGDIVKNDLFWVHGEYPGQGRLFGKLCVIPLKHFFHFEDMPEEEAAIFMKEVQCVGRALRKVTGAVKINYEMHANTAAHIHIHLFPRYLDDDFPSAPIDYRIAEPAPYENYDEFLWFVERMREELADHRVLS